MSSFVSMSTDRVISNTMELKELIGKAIEKLSYVTVFDIAGGSHTIHRDNHDSVFMFSIGHVLPVGGEECVHHGSIHCTIKIITCFPDDYQWFMSRKEFNRLQHAANGNYGAPSGDIDPFTNSGVVNVSASDLKDLIDTAIVCYYDAHNWDGLNHDLFTMGCILGDGTKVVYRSVLNSISDYIAADYSYVWFLSNSEMNRLQHAANGNIVTVGDKIYHSSSELLPIVRDAIRNSPTGDRAVYTIGYETSSGEVVVDVSLRDLYDIITLDFSYMWSLSSKEKNRLQHAANGNTTWGEIFTVRGAVEGVLDHLMFTSIVSSIFSWVAFSNIYVTGSIVAVNLMVGIVGTFATDFYSYYSVPIGGRVWRIRYPRGPLQWIALTSAIGMLVYTFKRCYEYNGSVWEAKDERSRFEVNASWKRFIKRVAFLGLIPLEFMGQDWKDVKQFITHIVKSWKDATTLGDLGKELADIMGLDPPPISTSSAPSGCDKRQHKLFGSCVNCHKSKFCSTCGKATPEGACDCTVFQMDRIDSEDNTGLPPITVDDEQYLPAPNLERFGLWSRFRSYIRPASDIQTDIDEEIENGTSRGLRHGLGYNPPGVRSAVRRLYKNAKYGSKRAWSSTYTNTVSAFQYLFFVSVDALLVIKETYQHVCYKTKKYILQFWDWIRFRKYLVAGSAIVCLAGLFIYLNRKKIKASYDKRFKSVRVSDIVTVIPDAAHEGLSLINENTRNVTSKVSDTGKVEVTTVETDEFYWKCDLCSQNLDNPDKHNCSDKFEAGKHMKKKGGKRPKAKQSRKHMRNVAKHHSGRGDEPSVSGGSTVSGSTVSTDFGGVKTTTYAAGADQFNKFEQLRPGHAVISVPPVYMLVSTDKAGISGKVTVTRRGECLFVPRHCVAGVVKAEVLVGGGLYPVSLKVHVCKTNPDQVWCRLPAGVHLKALAKGLSYREPVETEVVILYWCDDSGIKSSVGKVGKKRLLGDKKQVCMYEFDASTVAGACGGVYIAASDGAVVGFHSIGAKSVNVLPKFFPATLAWNEEFRQFSESHKDYDVSIENEKIIAEQLLQQIMITDGKAGDVSYEAPVTPVTAIPIIPPGLEVDPAKSSASSVVYKPSTTATSSSSVPSPPITANLKA